MNRLILDGQPQSTGGAATYMNERRRPILFSSSLISWEGPRFIPLPSVHTREMPWAAMFRVIARQQFTLITIIFGSYSLYIDSICQGRTRTVYRPQ